MMEKLLKLKKYIKDWKVITACVAVIALVGGIGIYVSANSNVKFSILQNGSDTNYISIDKGESKSAELSAIEGTDDGITDENTDKAEYIMWQIGQLDASTQLTKNIIYFSANSGTKMYTQKYKDTFEMDAGNIVDLSRIKNAGITAVNPGKASIVATYRSPEKDANGIIPDEGAYRYSQSKDIYVPLDLKTYVDGSSTPNLNSSTAYQIGKSFSLKTNGGQENPVEFSYSNQNNVTGIASDGYSYVNFNINGGGYTTVTAKTKDCDMTKAVDKQLLSQAIRILGEVKFKTDDYTGDKGRFETINGEKYFFINKENVSDDISIPSTVIDPTAEGCGVRYIVENSDICSFDNGIIKAKKAGITKVTAGVWDDSGNTLTSDSFNVVVPFTLLYSESVINVDDVFTFETTAGPDAGIELGSANNQYLQKIAENPYTFKGLKAGKATITATLTINDPVKENIFKEGYGDDWYKIVHEVTIIDDFAIDKHQAYVSVGSSIEITAMGTDEDYVSNPVGYEIVEQQNPDLTEATSDLIKVEKKAGTENIYVITGLSGGNVKLNIYQNVRGVKKFDTCYITVTTPVSDMYIDPEVIKVNEGEVKEVQLVFNPEPTKKDVLWKSSDESIATIETFDDNKLKVAIHGVKGGTTTINAISLDNINKVAIATVKVRKPVTGISLPTNLTLDFALGQYQLVPTVLPEKPAGVDDDGVDRTVIWKSMNEDIATVSNSGLVTFKQPGQVTIMCATKDTGIEGSQFFTSCTINISVPVDSITLDTTKATIRKGDTLRITADVLPTTASNKNLIWESSDTSVATVSPNGVVTAVGTGRCTILCKSSDPSSTASAMCNIFVMQPVTGIELNTTEITVRKGQVFWLNANCLPTDADDKSVTWSSNNEEICTVEQDGKVTAVEAGTTTIVAMSNDSGMLATCKVIVTQPVTGIKLNSSYQEMWVGSKYAIIPTVEPIDAENKNVTYFSSDESVASVDEYGVVTALKGGNTIIEVTTEEYHLTATCTIVVKEYVSSITLSEHEKFLNVTETGTLTAVVETTTATNRGIVWSSSDDAICSVDKDGNLSGNRVGNAVITATAADGSGVYDTCIVHVVNPVTKITVEPDTVRMLVGDSYIVRAVVEPDNATIKDVDWSSSNESIAIVDEAGEIFALSTGKCKITATSKDGNNVKGSCWVYVTPVVNISSLKINSSEIYMLSGKSRQLAVRVRPANNTDSYDWYSTDTGIVTVNSNGVITTVGPGVADVVVESTANGVSSTCTVHSLAISRSSMRLEQYDSNYLDVIGIDSTDRVIWRSSNPRIATVDSSGKVVGRMRGTCNITAVTHDKTLYCTVTVFTAKKYNY